MVAAGGIAKIDYIERRRLETQQRLDSTKTQIERNKLGQFATPTVLASDILGYAKTLAPASQQIFFLDPAFGTGAFYSALLKSFPSLQIARAFGAALNDLGAEAPLERIESLARQKLSHCAATLAREADVSLEDLREGFARRYKSTRPQVQPPFPGVVEVCEYARSIGGVNIIITHRGRESTLQLLATHEMGAYFGYLDAGRRLPQKARPGDL